jgi:hypothetical protein
MEKTKVDPKVDKYTEGATGTPDPEMEKKANQYKQVLTELLHSPKSRDSVTATLTSSPDPFDSVPTAAVATNDMGVNLMKQSGHDVDFGVQLMTSDFLITELIHLGYAAAGWEELTEEDFAGIYEDTIQTVIERGLADGSIDPIQLQLEIEPLLDENQMAGGKHLQKQAGLEDGPSQGAMVDQQVQGKVRQKEGQMAKQQALSKQKESQGQAPQAMPQQALQGAQQGGGQ